MPGGRAKNRATQLDRSSDRRRLAAASRTLDRLGLELIARTLVDYEDLPQAATSLSLSADAAYKRRRRTEDRIAAFYRITVRRPASGRRVAVSRGAMADAA